MFTGIAVLGVLAGSLADLFHLQEPAADAKANDPASTGASPGQPVGAELAKLQAQLQAVEIRLRELAELIRASPTEPE
jgi:hypothetical protein